MLPTSVGPPPTVSVPSVLPPLSLTVTVVSKPAAPSMSLYVPFSCLFETESVQAYSPEMPPNAVLSMM